jgi:predicted regulator of Ras-like GTPase activity (Roadblock/LC7/MglB family)
MRKLLVLSALVCLISPVAAHADILAVCGGAALPNQGKLASIAATHLINPDSTDAVTAMTTVALSRDSAGFDVLVNWGKPNQVSLRSEGAEIMGNELGPDFIDLIVLRSGTHNLEHFLFNFDDQAGEMIWTASGGPPGAKDSSEFDIACTRPNH